MGQDLTTVQTDCGPLRLINVELDHRFLRAQAAAKATRLVAGATVREALSERPAPRSFQALAPPQFHRRYC